MAADLGVTLDRLVSDAMQTYTGDYDGPEPTPELIASLRQADADIDAGKGLTMAQVNENLAAKKATWLQNRPR